MNVRWTLFNKILLLIVGIMIFVYLVLRVILITYLDRVTYDQFSDQANKTSESFQKNIEVYFGDLSNGLNFLVNEFSGQPADEAKIRDDLYTLNQSKDFVNLCYISLENGTSYIEPYMEVPSDVDPTQRPWYKLAYGRSDIQWSEPYHDLFTDELVITGSAFVEMEDVRGVFGMDVSLNHMLDLIETNYLQDDGLVMLVTNKGEIIADSKRQYSQMQLSDLNDEALLNSNLITGTLTTDKGIYYLRQINFTDIRMITFISNEALHENGNQISFFITLILTFTMFIAVIVSFFLSKQITNPLIKLTKTMEASVNSGDIMLYQGNRTSNSDINTLILGYNNMATTINNNQQDLKLLSQQLMTSEKKLQLEYEKATYMAYNDALTDLPNRSRFEIVMKDYIEQKKAFALCFLDLDNFKHINDTYGHDYGDQVLIELSQRFKVCCDSQFFVSRLSGDEFGIILNGEHAIQNIESIASKILTVIGQPITTKDLEFHITASIGISLYPDDETTYAGLLANADIAMYEAKRMSKNQFRLFHQSQKEYLIDRINIENRLVHSIENNELYVCYQPLIDYNTGNVQGFEALVRWAPKDMKPIYPDVFIPIAEHNLFIGELGNFVLKESLDFGKRLNEIFQKPFEINVNVSVVQLHMDKFMDDTMNIINESGIDKSQINLEITESAAIEDDHMIMDKLNQLRQYGMKLSLDDFGTGYSSLSNVIRLSLTHMKIDRSIIIDATSKPEVYQLVSGFVEFAHRIGLKVVAEGIETLEMEDMVKQLKIDLAQGYLYSKPIKADDFIEYLNANQ